MLSVAQLVALDVTQSQQEDDSITLPWPTFSAYCMAHSYSLMTQPSKPQQVSGVIALQSEIWLLYPSLATYARTQVYTEGRDEV